MFHKQPTVNCCCLQPFEFTAAEQVRGQAAAQVSDSAGGLFAGASGPKPPPALSTAVLGMKVGGKVGPLLVSRQVQMGETVVYCLHETVIHDTTKHDSCKAMLLGCGILEVTIGVLDPCWFA